MMIELSLYPGETQDGETTRGHLYVFVDDELAAQYPVCAGPAGATRADRGGHTVEQTPAGSYVLGAAEHHTTPSWPLSVIPWGARLRRRPDGDIDWLDGGTWRAATGPFGDVTKAGLVFRRKTLGRPLTPDEERHVVEEFRNAVTFGAEYRNNDFGPWSWNLNQPAGNRTPYFLHTTPDNEQQNTEGRTVELINCDDAVYCSIRMDACTSVQ